MASAVITLRIIRRGDRAQVLLEHVAATLGMAAAPEPDARGLIQVRIPARGPRAWDEVLEALEAAGTDWREWLHLEARPRR